jgi:hypothetical protein
MRSAIICLVVLGLLALTSALPEMSVGHHFAKKALIVTRQISSSCNNGVQSCNRVLQNTINGISPSDPQATQKVCRAARTAYDCMYRALQPCMNSQVRQLLNQLLSEMRAICPNEFAGAQSP